MPSGRPPAQLGKEGRRLWRAVRADWDLDGADLIILEQACEVRDDVDRLRQMLRERTELPGGGFLIAGKDKVPSIAPWVRELRMQELLMVALLNRIGVVGSERGVGDPITDAGVYKDPARQALREAR